MRLRYEKVPLGPASHVYFYVREEREFAFDLHFHPEYELTWIEAGHGTRGVGHLLEPYAPGDLVLVGPNAPHTWASGGPGIHRAYVLQFSEAALAEDILQHPEAAGLRRVFRNSLLGVQFFGRAAEEIRSVLRRLPEADLWTRHALLYEVLAQTAAAAGRQRRTIASAPVELSAEEGERVSRLICWLEANLSEAITLDGAARSLSVSPRTLTRLLRRTTGKTLTQLANELRVHRACRLLSESERSIADACYSAGFQNLSHFNEQFKKYTGTTPRRFRGSWQSR